MESTWIIYNKQLTKKKRERAKIYNSRKAKRRELQEVLSVTSQVSDFEIFFLPVRGPALPGRRGNLSRCEPDVTARCRVTVYSESRISRRYLIDPPTRMRKVRAAPGSQSKFRISKDIFLRSARGVDIFGTRRRTIARARASFRNSIQASGALLWDSRGIDSRATGKIYTRERRSWIMKSARGRELNCCNSSFFEIVCIFGNLQAAWLVPDDVNPHLPIEFSFSLASNLYVARHALTYTIVFTPREYETFQRTHFFFVRSLFLPLFLRFSHSLRRSTRFRLPPEVGMIIHETRDREKRGNRDRGSLERREKTHNVYSSLIEDERSFQGSASVARIWIWKYATN